MTNRGEWEYEDSLDINKTIHSIFQYAHVYLRDDDAIFSFDSIKRCHRCHQYLPDVSASFLVREGDVLKGICPQCLTDIITNNENLLTCEGCGKRLPHLFVHHWYDPKDYRHVHTRQICQFCNAQLVAKGLWSPHPYDVKLNHILPNWELQRLYINNDPSYQAQREVEYPWPISPKN